MRIPETLQKNSFRQKPDDSPEIHLGSKHYGNTEKQTLFRLNN